MYIKRFPNMKRTRNDKTYVDELLIARINSNYHNIIEVTYETLRFRNTVLLKKIRNTHEMLEAFTGFRIYVPFNHNSNGWRCKHVLYRKIVKYMLNNERKCIKYMMSMCLEI